MKLQKIRYLYTWLLPCFALIPLLLLASCSKTPSLAERGYTVAVTYEFNGGVADETEKRVLYYKENQPLLCPGDSNEFKAPVLDGSHTLRGWYRARLDADGNLQYDSDGKILVEDTPFVFDGAVATENMTLVALWGDAPTVTILVDGRDPDVRHYEEDDVVDRFTYMEDRAGYTFYDYFLDEACTTPAVWPMTLHEGDHVTLYTKWLEGDVLILREASDLSKLAGYRNKTVWLDNDIDVSESRAGFPTLTDFSGKFLGNGHTLKNLNKTITLKRATPVAGLFGTLKSGAVIENVSFENVTLDLTIPMPADYGVGLLAGEAEDGVTVSGCRFTDCAITYAKFPGAADATVQYSAGTAWAGILGKTVGTPAFDGTGTVTVTETGNDAE